jgi:AraC-like DNA-binding protein
MQFELATILGSGVALGWSDAVLPQTIRGALRDPVVHVSLGAGCRYTLGRRRIELGPGAAILIPPGREFTRHGSAGRISAILVKREPLADEVAARLGDDAGDWAIDVREFDPLGECERAFESAIADWTGTFDDGNAAAQRHLCEARVISALADFVLRESAARPVTQVMARRLANLEAWIEANLSEPITLGRLCKVCGVGQRALQLAFRARRGLSPMRFVAERRLAAAHRLLAGGGPNDDVTGIAVGLGFSHLGRFAAMYRRAYGESPSQTLRR